MGFLDKVKATAEKVGEQAKQGLEQGKEKIADVQEKRKVDALLRDLGAAVFLDRTGKGTPVISSDIERLMADVRTLVEAGAEVDPPSPAGTANGPAEGGPTEAPPPPA